MTFFAKKSYSVTATAQHTISWTESKSLVFASSVPCYPWYKCHLQSKHQMLD